MAFVQVSMYSQVLEMDTNVSVLLPESRHGGGSFVDPNRTHPVLYCLHGHGDDHTAWIRKSCIELVARDYDLIVVMPTVQRGWYLDGLSSLKYETYIAEELPAKMQDFFHVTADREKTYVMGNSMGGYGALRMALKHQDRYAACCSLSPALPETFEGHEDTLAEFNRGIQLATGPFASIPGTDADIRALADAAAESDGPRTHIFACCGTEDLMTGVSFDVLDPHMQQLGSKLDYTSERGHGGHDWWYWNPRIKRFIESLGLEGVNAQEG